MGLELVSKSILILYQSYPQGALYLLIANLSVKMSISTMNIRVAQTVEVRCNFCFNWISGQNLLKKNLHSCESCLQKYVLHGFEVHAANGDIHKLHLFKQPEGRELCSKSFIDNLSQLRSHHDHSQKFQDCNEVIEEKFLYQEEEVQSSSIKDISVHNNDHTNLDFIKKMNTKSQFMNNYPDEDFQFGKPHQSCIFNISKVKEVKEPMTGAKSMKRFTKLEDFGRSLDKTRFLQRYQFYYDNDTLKSYTNQHPKIERQFGDELVNIPQFNLNFNSKRSVQKSKTSRSNISSQINLKYNKMEDEELKVRIQSGLEGKHQSETLQRIMAANLRKAYEETIIQNRTLQLISYSMEELDLQCYLTLFDLDHIQTIKLINVGLTDQQLPLFVDLIANKHIQTLVLTGNKLTEVSLNLFMNKSLPYLKELYLGKNPINKYRMKENINQLKAKFVLYL